MNMHTLCVKTRESRKRNANTRHVCDEVAGAEGAVTPYEEQPLGWKLKLSWVPALRIQSHYIIVPSDML